MFIILYALMRFTFSVSLTLVLKTNMFEAVDEPHNTTNKRIERQESIQWTTQEYGKRQTNKKKLYLNSLSVIFITVCTFLQHISTFVQCSAKSICITNAKAFTLYLHPNGPSIFASRHHHHHRSENDAINKKTAMWNAILIKSTSGIVKCQSH